MKKVLSVVLAVMLVFAVAPTVFANISVTLDGSAIDFADVPPQMINDRTMVPLRAIFDALGAEIDWDGYTQTVTATRYDVVVVMQIGNPVITVAGSDVELDVPPMLIDYRTMVPARAVAQSFGVNVDWDGYTQTVVLTTGYAPYVPAPYEPAPYVPVTQGNTDSSIVGRWGVVFLDEVHYDWGITFNADGTGYYFWGFDTEDMEFYWRTGGNGVIRTLWATVAAFGGWDYDFADTIYYSIDGNLLLIDDHPGIMPVQQRI